MRYKILTLIILLAAFAPCGVYAEEAAPEKTPAKEAPAEEAPTEEAAPTEGAEGDGTNAAYRGPFIELKQINVVGIYRGQAVRHMNYIIVLEMPDQAEYNYVLDKVEILRSAFVEELHVIGSTQRGALLRDFSYVKKRLMIIGEKLLGPGHLKDILVKSSFGRLLPEFYENQPNSRRNSQ